MLSDESSSDSETGRFKCRSQNQSEQTKHSNRKEDNSRPSGRHRPSVNDKYHREFERKRDDRTHYERHDRDRYRYSRHSPVRRRYSRERSAGRRSRDRERHRYAAEVRERHKPRGIRSSSRDRRRHSRSRSHKSSEPRKDVKEEIKPYVKEAAKETAPREKSTEKSTEKYNRKSREKSSSPEYRGKRSVIQKPAAVKREKGDSPIVVDHGDSDVSAEVRPGSYYSMVPAIVKEKSEESSEIDSSDDERLRAKLLNLEKELHKTRKKKSKKKHKRKSSKSSKDRDQEPLTVEVTSTTDVDKTNVSDPNIEVVEVSSTEKINQKDSIEEGEITSDDESQMRIEIDPTDLRHKLKRSLPKADTSKDLTGSKRDMCGPALPPHLEKKLIENASQDYEGPALPPNFEGKSKRFGPSIPDEMRQVLAKTDREVIQYENSDEDVGFGPLPSGAEDKWSEAHLRLEERALDMKIGKLDGRSQKSSEVKSREQWMLELPEGKAKYLGLEARSFRAKEGPDMSDRSSWTDTPEEKARKAAGIAREEDADAALQREARARHIANRDDEQERAVKKHKKKHKREESLLELHQKKLKKKKKKEEKEDGKKERRPFSRDVDLQVNRFDEAQKKSIIKKAQDLNTRFSRGESKFL